MSLRNLPFCCLAAYAAGQSRAQAREWMRSARGVQDRRARAACVRYALRLSRLSVKYIKQARIAEVGV